MSDTDTGGEDAVLVGDFFDSVDRDFLRDNEGLLSESDPDVVLNPLSHLLPSVSVDSGSDFPATVTPGSLVLSDSDSDLMPTRLTSTPVNTLYEESTPPVSPVLPDRQFQRVNNEFEFLSGVRNVPRTINYSDEPCFNDIRAENEDRWSERPITCLKYVDDCLSIEKLPFKNALRLNINGRSVSVVKAIKTNVHFRTVSANAMRRGMLLNSKKTRMITISAARDYIAESYIYDETNTRIDCDDNLKVLGFNFGKQPDVQEHMKITQKKFKTRLWTLFHLKKAGFKPHELVKVYECMPVSYTHLTLPTIYSV